MELLKKVVWPFRMLVAGIVSLLRALLGSFSWEPPVWVRYLGEKGSSAGGWARTNRFAATVLGMALLIIMAELGGGAYWYNHRPRPVETRFKIKAPELTQWEDNKAKVSACLI
ncbi:MAG: hypothetical protein P4L55_02775, partial [Syntrophobacteraceae bacterium]|nr:hypothetical protein [Syntrophobacteraceae bacterium]